MNVLKIQNCFSWLVSDDLALKEKLWEALRFRENGYFHNSLYKRKLWDGFTDYFKKDSGRFLTGLLPEVQSALKHWDVKFQVIDERTKIDFRFQNINENFLDQWKTDKEILLHDYQAEFTNKILKHKRGVVQAPTGAGKTFIMISILKCIPPDCPTLILANRKSLCDQNFKAIDKWQFPNIGRLYDKYNSPNIITCASVQSLHKMEKMLPKIKVLIVDEIHDMMSKKPRQFYNKMKDCSVRVAVSATPFKFGGRDKSQKFAVKGYFGPVMNPKNKTLTTKELQERNILSKTNINFYEVTEPSIPYHLYADAIADGIANNWKFHHLVKNITSKLTGRTLIFVERIAHGDMLQSIMPNAIWVQGKDDMETRNEVIKRLQSDENALAIATQGIFNAGVDFFVHNLINAAGGKADHQIIQRMGRGLRPAEDKDILNYIDFLFLINDYLEDHSRLRISILEKEGHVVTVKKEL